MYGRTHVCTVSMYGMYVRPYCNGMRGCLTYVRMCVCVYVALGCVHVCVVCM